MTVTATEMGSETLAPGLATVVPPTAPAGILVLGLGNDILTDDAVGLRVVRALRAQLDPDGPVRALEVEEMGLSLLDYIVGCRALVLVDAIQTGTVPPGTLHELDGSVLQTRRGGSPHFLGVGETLALGRLLGLAMPERVRIFAIEVADPYTLGTELTPTLTAAVPGALARVHAAVSQLVMERA
jgi:hydrogenase maturation protease